MVRLPAPSRVREYLNYEQATGRLTWLPRWPEHFTNVGKKAAHKCRIWNAKWAGKEAFTAEQTGYRVGAIDCQRLYAHRVIWAWMTGAWPEKEIDHINGDPGDNRWVNLRHASRRTQSMNAKLHKDSRTGITGVGPLPDGRYRARMRLDGVEYSLGHYDTIEAAAAARRVAEIKFGFHPNHGRKSNLASGAETR